MVMYNVYTSNIKRKYRAHFCSFATLFLICTLGLTVICPVLVAYHSNGKNNFQILTLLDDNVEGTFLEVGRSFQLLKFHYFPGYEILGKRTVFAEFRVFGPFPRSFRTRKVGEITIFYAERRKRMQVEIFYRRFFVGDFVYESYTSFSFNFITRFPKA